MENLRIWSAIIITVSMMKESTPGSTGTCYEPTEPVIWTKDTILKIDEINVKLEDIQSLNLCTCNIMDVKEDAFSNMSSLQSLDLSFNYIRNLYAKTFQDLKQVSTINLSHNSLMYLAPHLFENCENLKVLDLSDNFLVKDRLYEMLMANQKLKEVDFSNNMDTSADDCGVHMKRLTLWSRLVPCKSTILFPNDRLSHIFSAGNVKEVSFRNNSITGVDSDVLKKYPLLEMFDVSYNNIEYISEEFLSYAGKLIILNLSHNNLTDINGRFTQNNVMISLDLSGNSIAQLIDPFKNLSELTILNVSKNFLTQLDEKIFFWNTELVELDLSHNLLTKLEAKIFYQQEYLTFVSLRRNKLISLSSSTFFNNVNLEVLDLSHNELITLSPDFLTYTNELRFLSLSGNRFNVLDNSLFSKISKLEHLILSNNNLNTFSVNMISHMTNLKVLDLHNNIITAITADTFRLPALEYLILSLNRLTLLPVDMFSVSYNATKIKVLVVNGNPFECTCLYRVLLTASKLTTYQKKYLADGDYVTCIVDYKPNCETGTITSSLYKHWKLQTYQQFENTCFERPYIKNYTEVYKNTDEMCL